MWPRQTWHDPHNTPEEHLRIQRSTLQIQGIRSGEGTQVVAFFVVINLYLTQAVLLVHQNNVGR